MGKMAISGSEGGTARGADGGELRNSGKNMAVYESEGDVEKSIKNERA